MEKVFFSFTSNIYNAQRQLISPTQNGNKFADQAKIHKE